MRARLVGDLLLVTYLILTGIPLGMLLAGFLLTPRDGSTPSTIIQFDPMGCVLFFFPAHIAACTILGIDLIQRRKPSGLLWAPLLLFGAWLTVPFYYWFRVRPGLAASTPLQQQT